MAQHTLLGIKKTPHNFECTYPLHIIGQIYFSLVIGFSHSGPLFFYFYIVFIVLLIFLIQLELILLHCIRQGYQIANFPITVSSITCVFSLVCSLKLCLSILVFLCTVYIT